MDSYFDEVVSRVGTQSNKWKECEGGVISLSVADMDFRSPKEIIDPILERLEHGIFGYTSESDALDESIISHLKEYYKWSIDSNSITYLPSSVTALFMGVIAFSDPGDHIIVPSPVYHNITLSAELSNRKAIDVKMKLDRYNRWVLDFDSLEAACDHEKSKIIMICNPHNPGGTVYKREELFKILEIALKNEMYVISDEVHCDLILSCSKHLPFSSISSDAKKITMTIMSPSKTYNTAGLGLSFVVIEDEKMMAKFRASMKGVVPTPNIIGLVAAQAAYKSGKIWKDNLIAYLAENKAILRNRLKKSCFKFYSLEATFLDWIDISSLGIRDSEELFMEFGVKIIDGERFGRSGFIRVNFACPKEILNEAIDRILMLEKSVIKEREKGKVNGNF